LCVLFLTELFPINSLQLLEVVANDFIAGNAATHPWAVPNTFTC